MAGQSTLPIPGAVNHVLTVRLIIVTLLLLLAWYLDDPLLSAVVAVIAGLMILTEAARYVGRQRKNR